MKRKVKSSKYTSLDRRAAAENLLLLLFLVLLLLVVLALIRVRIDRVQSGARVCIRMELAWQQLCGNLVVKFAIGSGIEWFGGGGKVVGEVMYLMVGWPYGLTNVVNGA